MFWVWFLAAWICLAVSAVTWVARQIRSPTWVTCGQSYPLSWYLDEASQTGDLVFFRNSNVTWLHDWVSPLTHVGMLVQHPVTGEPWMLETHEEGDLFMDVPQKGGVHLYPARARLSSYDGSLMVSRIVRPLPAARVLSLANALKDVPHLDGQYMHVGACKLWPFYDPTKKEGMMCSEFVALLVSRLCMPGAPWRCFTPADVLSTVTRSSAYTCAIPLHCREN